VFNSVAFMSVFLEIVSLLSTWKFGFHELRIWRQTRHICYSMPTFTNFLFWKCLSFRCTGGIMITMLVGLYALSNKVEFFLRLNSPTRA
jgi:hypothetical protein